MAKKANNPFYFVGVPLLAVGCAFAAIGASGQEAFGWTSIGLLVPGVALLVAGLMNRRRAS
ncbi:hypothetical protein [Pseudomonas coleopterorum]|uniref:Lipoprotein n=1 Tax=Pseudomonas coleopterorum TaxID=1605838 RepID=A0ABR9BX59_9PSED|nr:hypothetical protein [Pseudomonas coleopterorum]MBD8754225.1 hypothetical protein [Pseudomonas coleopterorum]MBD8769681.1 hypothetical protein [Pseudomonas coleopterorum]MDY1045398.1 hypothetical protein [Pseudomonas coleopterorum]